MRDVILLLCVQKASGCYNVARANNKPASYVIGIVHSVQEFHTTHKRIKQKQNT